MWRWKVANDEIRAEVKFELLADLDSEANQATVYFNDCESLGAVNLRGTGYAARDVTLRVLTAKVGDDVREVKIRVTGVAGFLLPSVPRRIPGASGRTGTTSPSCC